MIKVDERSNAQSWELEITCKNKQYLDAVVGALLKIGKINFEVQNIECLSNHEEWDARYTVFMWCSWFSILEEISTKLSQIEVELESR